MVRGSGKTRHGKNNMYVGAGVEQLTRGQDWEVAGLLLLQVHLAAREPQGHSASRSLRESSVLHCTWVLLRLARRELGRAASFMLDSAERSLVRDLHNAVGERLNGPVVLPLVLVLSLEGRLLPAAVRQRGIVVLHL